MKLAVFITANSHRIVCINPDNVIAVTGRDKESLATILMADGSDLFVTDNIETAAYKLTHTNDTPIIGGD